MSNSFFTLLLGLALFPMLLWACRVLPREEWQFIAALPVGKSETADDCRHGVNLTYYGALLATGSLFGTVIFFLLLASLGVSRWGIIGMVSGVMGCSTAAAKLIAMAVEKKRTLSPWAEPLSADC